MKVPQSRIIILCTDRRIEISLDTLSPEPGAGDAAETDAGMGAPVEKNWTQYVECLTRITLFDVSAEAHATPSFLEHHSVLTNQDANRASGFRPNRLQDASPRRKFPLSSSLDV